MINKKILTAIKKAAGKKGVHSLTHTFHIIEHENVKWLYATDNCKLFAVTLPDEYTLKSGAYSIDDIMLVETHKGNESLKLLDEFNPRYTQSPDFFQIIPKDNIEQSNLNDIPFNYDYLGEMINFISLASSNSPHHGIKGIKIYKGKPATYQASNVMALLMPMKD